MFIFIHLLLQAQAQVGCFISSIVDNTQCQFCSYGYIPPSQYPGLCTIQSVVPQQSNFIYVSNTSTCTSTCGSSTNQYSNLYDAINNIPYPPNTIIPTYTIVIQTDIYLTGSGYLNRRKLINLIIRNDPNSLTIPTIYIKTNALSIFTSAQLTISNLKFDGIGLNDQPYNPNSIYCNLSFQSKLYNSSDGISSPGQTQTCGIRYFTISQSSQSEFYGLFTTEPMFEIKSNPILSITQCSFQNIYYINSSPITISLIQIGINLPSIIQLTNVNITNSFFQNGIINQQNYQNSILQALNATTQALYDNYNLSYQQINLNYVVIQSYNQQFISNYVNNNKQTGMILTAINMPIQTNINQLQILGTMLMTRIYFQQNGQSVSLADGITYGHYYLYYFKSQNFKVDQSGNMITSALNISNTQIMDTYSNAFFLFYASSQRDYFLSNKTYNIIYLNQIIVNNSATQFFVQYGNTNLVVDVIQFLNGDFNNFFLARGEIFNYVGLIKVYSVLKQNITGYYVDDNINEKNVFIFFDNSSVTTSWYPSTVDIYNHTLIGVNDIVQLEGGVYFPSYTYISNIVVNNLNLIYLSWHLYGLWPMYLFQIKNVQLMNKCKLTQLINIKQVPDLFLIQNISIRFNIFMDNLVQLRTNMVNIPNFVIIMDNITIYYNETERAISNYSQEQLFRDNTGVFTNPSILGSVTLQNSNIMMLMSDLYPYGFFQVRSAFNFYVINCTIQFYGVSIFYFIVTSYQTQTVETFQIINTNITRNKVHIIPDSQLKQSDLVVIDQMDDFMPFSSRHVLIRNTSIIDSGRSFSRILMVKSQNIIFDNVKLYNIGVYYSKMSGTVSMNNVNFDHNNTNSSSYFLIVEGINIPTWTQSAITLPGNKTNLIIISNTNFTGQLAQGLVQISNAIVLLTNCNLNSLSSQINTASSSSIILKQNGWLQLYSSNISSCNNNKDLQKYCIVSYSDSYLEIYNTLFQNSMGSYGGFIYCYGMYGYLQQTTFQGGTANNGGAIYVIKSKIIVQNSYFGITSVTYTGGHIFIESSQLSISNSVFQNSSVIDSGGSLYAVNMITLIIQSSQFNNISSNSGILFLSASQLSPSFISDCVFQNSFANQSLLGQFQFQQLMLTNTHIQNLTNLQQSIAVFKNCNSTITSFQCYLCKFDQMFQSQDSQLQLNNVIINNSQFLNGLIQMDSSNFTLLGITIQYNISQLIADLKGQGLFGHTQKSILIISTNSNISILNATLSILTLVSVTQEYSDDIQEINSIIQSTNSNILIQNVTISDDFQVISQVFKRRLLLLTDLLLMTPKVLDVTQGQIVLNNITIPNFAVRSSMFSFKNATITINNLKNEFLTLTSQSILENYCKVNTSGYCDFIDFRLSNSTFNMNDTNIKSYGTTIYALQSIISINSTNLSSRTSQALSSALYAKSSQLSLYNISITNNNQRSIFIDSNMTIKNGQVSNTKGFQIQQGIVLIDSINFLFNSNENGGAIISTCPNSGQIVIQNSQFYNNSATVSGGAIRNINCNLSLDASNLFSNNTASFGINQLGYPSKILINQMLSYTSISQSASISNLQAQKYLASKTFLQLNCLGGINTIFTISLVDNFNQIFPIASYFNSSSFVSQYNQNETSNVLSLVPSNSSIIVQLKSYTFDLLNNVIFITESHIYGYQNQSNITISVYLNQILIGTFQLNILLCPQGSLASTDRCYICPQNTYSLNPLNSKCENCQQNMICLGKNYIFAETGYYIPQNTSDPIVCPVMDGCLQTILDSSQLDQIYYLKHYKVQVSQQYQQLILYEQNDTIKLVDSLKSTYCNQGYNGQLCVYCDEHYGQTSDGLCYQCGEDAMIYIKFGISTLLIIILNYQNSVEPLEEEQLGDPELSNVLFRILTDFTQISNTIVDMAQNTNQSVLPTLSIFTTLISVFPTDFNSGFSCILLNNIVDPKLKFEYELLIGALIPWIYLVLMILLIIFIDKIKKSIKKEALTDKVKWSRVVIVCMVASFYNFYMYLSQSSLSIFSCIQVNDYELGTKTLLSTMTDIECWEKDHLQLIFMYGLPTLIMYVIGIPITFIFFIQKFHKTGDTAKFYAVDQEDMRQSIDLQEDQSDASSSVVSIANINYSIFLTKHLDQKYKYWGVYIQIKKLIINLIMVLQISLGVNAASILVLIVFIIFLLISYKYQPYTKEKLNQFESMQDLYLTLIMHLVLLIIQSSSLALQALSAAIIVIIKFIFYFVIIKIIVAEYLEYFRKKAKSLKKSQSKTTPSGGQSNHPSQRSAS